MNVIEKLINPTETFLDHFQSNDRNSRLKRKKKRKVSLDVQVGKITSFPSKNVQHNIL